MNRFITILMTASTAAVLASCGSLKDGNSSELNETRTAPGQNEIVEQLKKVIPETASAAIIIEAGQETQLVDEANKISISFPANSFTEFAAASIEPVAEADADVLAAATAAEVTALTAVQLKNPVFMGGFKLLVQNSSEAIASALDITICQDFATYDPNYYYVAVVTNLNQERTSIQPSLAEGTATALCFSTIEANASVHFIRLEAEAVVVDTTPPTGISLSFSVLSSDLTTGTAQITLTGEGATQMEIVAGETCSQEPTWVEFATSVANYPITLNGEVNQRITLSVSMRDASLNVAACVSETIDFVNTIAQNQLNQQTPVIPVQVDTNPPSAPTGIVNPLSTFEKAFAVSWSKSSDLDVASYNLKMCPTDQTCSICTSTTQAVQKSETPSATVSNIAGNTPFYVCLQAVDTADNASEWARSAATTTYLANNITPFIKRIGDISKGSLNPDGAELSTHIAYDRNERAIYIGGITDGSFAGTNQDSNGTQDIYVVKATYQGDILWARQLVNPTNNSSLETLTALLVDSNGDVIVGGHTGKDFITAGANTSMLDDLIFAKLAKEDGNVEIKKQILASGAQELSGMIPNGNGGFYIAVTELLNTGVEDKHFINVRSLESDLETISSSGLLSPWIRIGPSLNDKKLASMQLGNDGQIILGTTLDADETLAYCQDKHDEHLESDCGSAGGTWRSGITTSGGGKDALVVKISTAEGSLGEITDYYQFGANFSNGSTRDASKNDSIFRILVNQTSNAVYVQGATLGDFAEANGDSTYNTADIFVARLSSDLELSWATQLGQSSIGAGSSSMEISNGSFAYTEKNQLITSFGSASNYLQESSAGNMNSVFVAFGESDGSIAWKKQLGETGSGFIVASSIGDVFGNIYFTGHAGFGSFIEPGTTANDTASNLDLVFGVLSPDGVLELP